MSVKHKTLKITLISIVSIILIITGSFFIWANDYYPAQDDVVMAMRQDNSIETIDNLTILTPENESETGIIFYPGAKVEAISYIPLLNQLKNAGYTCVLVEMPFNMAVFDSDAADKVFEILPNIQNWYMAGHSMGGAMASDYASKNQNKIDGLILMGAYIYGDYPPEKALTIYGTFNLDLEKNIDYTENIIKIEGGNHAGFGNYGKQKGDPDATISTQEQQNITVNAIIEFIQKNK